MSEETKTEVDWKKETVNGANGKKWQDLHDEVVRQHELALLERDDPMGGSEVGYQNFIEAAKKAAKLARDHEKKMIKQGHLTEAERKAGIHHRFPKWVGSPTVHTASGEILTLGGDRKSVV